MGHGQWAGDSNPDMPGAKARANHQAPRSSLHKAATRHRLKELEVLREASWSSDKRQLPTGRQITSKGLGVGVRQQGFPGGSVVKNLSAMQEMQETWDRTLGSRTGVQSLGLEDALEEEMTTHSSILAWEIPWTESGRLQQSVGSKRVRHDLVTENAHNHMRQQEVWSLAERGAWQPLKGQQLLSSGSFLLCGNRGPRLLNHSVFQKKWDFHEKSQSIKRGLRIF